ncbi:hypothetical protein HY604_00900, partial [Candidatus Peregrinibacteria bacterium]|nr:hypothetical protein [Candidatus Peregrinibacteria bacterium]
HAMDTYQDVETLNELWKNGAPWKIWQNGINALIRREKAGIKAKKAEILKLQTK